MKKLLAIILSIAMLACCVVVASAEEAVTVTVQSKDAATVNVGDTIVLGIELSKVEFGYAVFEIGPDGIIYDKEVLELIGYDSDDDEPVTTLPGAAAFGTGGFGYISDKTNTKNQSGTLVGLKFKVLKAEATEVKINVQNVTTYSDAAGVENTVPTVTVVAGGLTKVVIPEEVTAVEELIKKIPTEITADAVAAVNAAKAAYDALTPDQQKLVDPALVTTLTSAVEAVEKLDNKDDDKDDDNKDDSKTDSKPESKTDTKGGSSVPKTADNSVVFFAGILCLAMAAAFVITKKVKD